MAWWEGSAILRDWAWTCCDRNWNNCWWTHFSLSHWPSWYLWAQTLTTLALIHAPNRYYLNFYYDLVHFSNLKANTLTNSLLDQTKPVFIESSDYWLHQWTPFRIDPSLLALGSHDKHVLCPINVEITPWYWLQVIDSTPFAPKLMPAFIKTWYQAFRLGLRTIGVAFQSVTMIYAIILHNSLSLSWASLSEITWCKAIRNRMIVILSTFRKSIWFTPTAIWFFFGVDSVISAFPCASLRNCNHLTPKGDRLECVDSLLFPIFIWGLVLLLIWAGLTPAWEYLSLWSVVSITQISNEFTSIKQVPIFHDTPLTFQYRYHKQ